MRPRSFNTSKGVCNILCSFCAHFTLQCSLPAQIPRQGDAARGGGGGGGGDDDGDDDCDGTAGRRAVRQRLGSQHWKMRMGLRAGLTQARQALGQRITGRSITPQKVDLRSDSEGGSFAASLIVEERPFKGGRLASGSSCGLPVSRHWQTT